MIKFEKVVVCCSTSVTGGPELLHQLVDKLRKLGHNAYISYFPFDETHQCPDAYRKYDAPQTRFDDTPGTFVIVPEVATRILKHIKHAEAAIWWLSVDNYFLAKHQSILRDFYLRYKSLIRRRVPLRSLRKYRHFVQSVYAKNFLQRFGIASSPLYDYLSKEHLVTVDKSTSRRDIVVFNPNKGHKQTLKLREANPDIEFVPIQNMTAGQVAELLASAKIYIDFGHHPGKDRPPREAAMAGCCVITGKRGSARYFEDIPIPDAYKLDDSSDAYILAFRSIADDIFANFSKHAQQFERYCEIILREQTVFEQQVESLFGRKNSND